MSFFNSHTFLMYLGNHFLDSRTDDLSFNLFSRTLRFLDLPLAFEQLFNVSAPITSPLAQFFLS